MRGFDLRFSEGKVWAIHESNPDTYLESGDEDSPYWTVVSAFIDVPFVSLGLVLGAGSAISYSGYILLGAKVHEGLSPTLSSAVVMTAAGLLFGVASLFGAPLDPSAIGVDPMLGPWSPCRRWPSQTMAKASEPMPLEVGSMRPIAAFVAMRNTQDESPSPR